MANKVHWRRLAIVEDKNRKERKEVQKKINNKKVHWRRLPIID